jgi:hypothetical protein
LLRDERPLSLSLSLLLRCLSVAALVCDCLECIVVTGGDVNDLTGDQLKVLYQWKAKFESKYKIVGTLALKK